MFEKTTYQCPRCKAEIHEAFEEIDVYTCRVCASRFRVLADEASGALAFVEEHPREAVEPLNLPKGSVRSMVAIVAVARHLLVWCWAMLRDNKPWQPPDVIPPVEHQQQPVGRKETVREFYGLPPKIEPSAA